MLKRFCTLLVTALAAATLSMVGQAPANAVTYVNVKANNVRIATNNCTDVPVTISGDWVDADINVTMFDPNGDGYAGGVFDDTTGVLDLTVEMCGSDQAGTYEVYAEVYDYNDDSTDTGYDTFVLSTFNPTPKAKSKIVTKRSYQPKERAFKWLVGGKLLRKNSVYKGKRVSLQARIDGRWYEIDAGRTNRKGLVAWQFKPSRTAWRYYFAGDAKTAPASKAFRASGRHGKALLGQGMTNDTPKSVASMVDRA